MNRIYYDCGTTNTRGYLFENSQLKYTLAIPTGSKDAALSDNRLLLLHALKDIYDGLLTAGNLCESEISEIWMSGMISSSTGLIEIPHLTAPIDRLSLKKGIVCYHESLCFKRDLYIIPGIKTVPPSGQINFDTFDQVNNMRGEETEIFGILDQYPCFSENSIIILPGSHTQVAFIQDGSIVNILSAITGELYDALSHHTILSTSLCSDQKIEIIPEMVVRGLHALEKLGINRALYTIRTMELFLNSTNSERHSYFEGILNGGIVRLIKSLLQADEHPQVVVYGSYETIEVFRALFNALNLGLTITGVEKGAVPYSAYGFLCLSR